MSIRFIFEQCTKKTYYYMFIFTVEAIEGTSLYDDFKIVKSLAFVTEKFCQLTTIITSLREYHYFGKEYYIKSLYFYNYFVVNNFG